MPALWGRSSEPECARCDRLLHELRSLRDELRTHPWHFYRSPDEIADRLDLVISQAVTMDVGGYGD